MATSSPRLLIVDPQPSSDLVGAARAQGLDTNVTRSLSSARRVLQAYRPDLVVLECDLPDGAGADLCRVIRDDQSLCAVPILVVAARNEEIDRVVMFELGVDDYVAKPYSTRELLLRIRALLRRASRRHRSEPRTRGIEVDIEAHRVVIDGREVIVSGTEARIVRALLDASPRPVPRATLYEILDSDRSDPDSRAIDAHMKRLRHKFGNAADRLQSVRSVGYRLVESN